MPITERGIILIGNGSAFSFPVTESVHSRPPSAGDRFPLVTNYIEIFIKSSKIPDILFIVETIPILIRLHCRMEPQKCRKDITQMDMILETLNLTKKFKKQTAVDRLSIGIERNSVYGLLGPNGAGKSTTLKMITGMQNPSSGSIKFEGHQWHREDLKDIGALIETPPIYDNLTAKENLRVKTTLLGIPESRIDEVLQTVDLTGTGKKKAGQFSMGMKQRLGIALALLNRPKLLILDEPTNGLDPLGIQDMRELIRSFPKQGITVILSSHILSEVEQIADHIGIIVNGRLGYSGVTGHEEDLEALFMRVMRECRKEAD